MSLSQIKVVLIGAAGGIGQCVCEQVYQGGGEAFLIGRTADRLRPLADRYGWGFAVADASNWDQLSQAVSSADGVLGGVNAAINLAGSFLLKPAHLTGWNDWQETVSANLSTAFGVVRNCAPLMFSNGGSIVMVSSAAATIGLSNHEAIAACKAGIEGLVRSAAMTYASKSIRINAIAPGLVETQLSERIWGQPRAAETSLGMHPLGRFGKPDEIARAILWLASPEQSWITGQTLGVDGGLGKLKPTR
jgi:NAD(P)-dependent dehydrogenase (short-subunit alcohol dehydrogenase family)